jgi:formylglycine-generating enzyme required for sulfatase activity
MRATLELAWTNWRTVVLAGCILLLAAGCNKGGIAPGISTAPQVIKTKSGIEMVVIPASSFAMGSRTSEDEKPIHKVWIDSFLIDKFEVTQAEYEKLGRDSDPPFANASVFRGPDMPVQMVTWPKAALFCNARSIVEGLKPCYKDNGECDFVANGYRLPTEAEWEYACRAGSTTDWSFGNEERQLGDYAWFSGNAGKKTHPVGQKKPNAWGLYDMHGNVAEWCNDAYDKNYYKSSPERNPHGPSGDKEYVLRGGSWKSKEPTTRSSARLGAPGGFSDACLAPEAIGFRCVRQSVE